MMPPASGRSPAQMLGVSSIGAEPTSWLPSSRRLAGQQVRPPARVLDLGVRLADVPLLDAEAGRRQPVLDLLRLEEVEVDRDRRVPPLLQVEILGADVERHQ